MNHELKSSNEANHSDSGIQVTETTQEMPQLVVRFYGNTDYALECLAFRQITFIHVDKLNDPFDPLVDYVTDFNDSYEALLVQIQKSHPLEVALFKQRLPEQKWKEAIADWAALAKKMREQMFVFSTCAVTKETHPRDSLYMWGHYGNGHRGVAIEFNTTALSESFIKEAPAESEPPWWKMDYKKVIPSIQCEDIIEFILNAQSNEDNLEAYGPKLTQSIKQRLHSKGDVWKSEAEWRLVWGNDETKLKIQRHDIPSSAVTAVYLGCRAAESDQLRNDFIFETKRNYPSAIVLRGCMRSGAYALDFERID